MDPNSTNNQPSNPTDLPSPIPTTAPNVVAPDDNPMTAAKIDLGRHLFYDGRISVLKSMNPRDSFGVKFSPSSGIACASCHDPQYAFTDPNHRSFSVGVENAQGVRNAPTLTNVAFNTSFTWDGKFATLEKHTPGPMFSPIEMGNNLSRFQNDSTANGYGSDPGSNDTMFLFHRLNSTPQGMPGYSGMFKDAYGTSDITLDRMVKAITSFERTMISHSSPFDQYNSGNKTAIGDAAKRGFQLFINPAKANCIACHNGYNFSNSEFRNNGLVPSDKDLGRFKITKAVADINKFKVPTLRNIALTAPYMHDGRFATLDDVLQHYNSGGSNQTYYKDPAVKPLGLSQQELSDLKAFLETLTDTQFTTDASFSNPWVK
ncbi:MAG: c-type cytochrome [Bacteroidetes bacterium]|nr:c-type cytochrome [Bacteroidota bacterium]